ncbi:MAG: nucleoside-diphosphate kinase, partial [Elusimicrobiota bacterium]
MTERTCVIIKPDGLGKKTVGKIIDRLESEGFKLLAIKMIKAQKSKIEEFYGIHRNKDYFQPLVEFICCMPIIVTVWEGKNAVKAIRKI